MAREPHWSDHAACKGVDQDRIFPSLDAPEEEARKSMHRFAMQYCRSCPVKAPCLAEALRFKDKFGVWGGIIPTGKKRNP